MSRQLVYETLGDVKGLNIQRTSEGLMRLTGTFGVCGVRNNNNRVYEKGNYGKMVAEMQNRIKSGSVLGELEHPKTMNITLENVSHKIDDIQIDENGLVSGTITLLNTPKGKIAQAIVEGGAPLFISSRATGNVDQNGNVQLEKLQTYDLVGSPGFSQARLQLAESMNESQFGSICESIYYINLDESEEPVSVEPTNEENNSNEDKMINEEILNRLAELEAEVAECKKNLFTEATADAIQNWVVNEFGGKINEWVENEVMPSTLNEDTVRDIFTSEYAPKIEEWVCTEFAGAVNEWVCTEFAGAVNEWVTTEVADTFQNWVVEEYTPTVESWITEDYSNGVQNWLVEQFAPCVQNWINEEYAPTLKAEITNESSANKVENIESLLTALESYQPSKETYSRKQIQESLETPKEPKFIAEMPEDARVKWNMASREVKESIERRAKLYSFNTPSAINEFWSRVSFDEPASVNETRHIVDSYEEAVRAQIRRNHARF